MLLCQQTDSWKGGGVTLLSLSVTHDTADDGGSVTSKFQRDVFKNKLNQKYLT